MVWTKRLIWTAGLVLAMYVAVGSLREALYPMSYVRVALELGSTPDTVETRVPIGRSWRWTSPIPAGFPPDVVWPFLVMERADRWYDRHEDRIDGSIPDRTWERRPIEVFIESRLDKVIWEASSAPPTRWGLGRTLAQTVGGPIAVLMLILFTIAVAESLHIWVAEQRQRWRR
jgi:hypothetical protein